MKEKLRLWLILAAVVLLIATALVVTFQLLLPYYRAASTMPVGGSFIIEQQEDGSLLLSWPAAFDADFYRVELLLPPEENTPEDAEETEPRVFWSQDISGVCACTLPAADPTQTLTLRVTCAVYYQSFGKQKIRFGDSPMEITTTFDAPTVQSITWEADAEEKLVWVDFDTKDGDRCRVYLENADGTRQQMRELKEESFYLKFGSNGELPIPTFGGSHTFTFNAYRQETGLVFYGIDSGSMTVVRDDLLGRNLNLRFTDEGYNVCSLTWDETKGNYYEVQLLEDDQWVTVAQVAGDGERTYTSPHMPIYDEFTYRVVAVGDQPMEGSDYAAVSESYTLTTTESPIYATIWPVKDLPAYADAGGTTQTGTAEEGKAYCVLEEVGGMFGIRIGEAVCYIDSSYCMINLPDYIGDLCQYKITNSYRSIYMVHEFEIPEVTDVVTAGYGNVRQDDGSYLVPLLYPTAKKLVTAAKSAREMGYCLRIYDAFRPNRATREIYDLTEAILDEPLPEEPFTDARIEDLDLPEVPEEETPSEPVDGEAWESKLTYRMVMTDEQYDLSYFLAGSGSTHNQGVALDLTLVDLEGGWEVEMQTSMHDLSRYSIIYKNNYAADILAQIMKDAGFGDLVSEWWHFQDNEARKALELPYVWGGISGEGWMADDNGWRYRRSDGTWYTGCTTIIGEETFVFDENGYLIN